MVGNGHGGVAFGMAQLVEPGVAQPPGGHLHRLAGALHLGRGLEAAVVPGDSVPCGLVPDEEFVLVALGAPELEVAVRDAHRVSAADEEREHDHRVHAARDGQQDAVVVRHEVVLVDVALKGFDQCHLSYSMFTSVSISIPNRSRTRCRTRCAKAMTSPPVAPP